MTIARKARRRGPRGASSGRPRAPSRGRAAAAAAATKLSETRGLGQRPRSGVRGGGACEPRDSPGRGADWVPARSWPGAIHGGV